MVQGEFVGRRRELACLRGWLMAAVEGQPRLVLCGGEPGIGKTRLASELAKVASTSYGAGVVWARASEDRGAPPFWLWRQALPSSDVLSAHVINRGEPDQAAERFAFFDDATRQLFAAAAGGRRPAAGGRRRPTSSLTPACSNSAPGLNNRRSRCR